MSLPSTERTSPRRVAYAAAESGRFHDVVIAASKVLHEAQLDAADRAALKWARVLLDKAESSTMVVGMPSATQLAGDGTVMAAIRRAAQPENGSPDEPLRHLRVAIDACLSGKRGADVTAAMGALRELFAMVSHLALQADVLSQGEPPAPTSWGLWTTSLTS